VVDKKHSIQIQAHLHILSTLTHFISVTQKKFAGRSEGEGLETLAAFLYRVVRLGAPDSVGLAWSNLVQYVELCTTSTYDSLYDEPSSISGWFTRERIT
jgi:hypothetical protein